MARRGPHEWLARSPDLTPSNFFPWGRLKEQVYCTKPTSLEEREGRICDVLSSTPQESLVKSVDVFPSQLENLVTNAGTHIEF